MEKTVKGQNGKMNKPKWWSDGIEASWEKVKVATVADWKKVVAGEKRVETKIDEGALAFGYGARKAYHQLEVWGGELETKLKADWKETVVDAEHAWDKVSGAVQHGWEQAFESTRSDPPAAPRGKPAPSSRA